MRAAVVEQRRWLKWRRGRIEYGPLVTVAEGEVAAGIGYVRKCLWRLFVQLCAGSCVPGVVSPQRVRHCSKAAGAWLGATLMVAGVFGVMLVVDARFGTISEWFHDFKVVSRFQRGVNST
jgi:hypothetical protein